MDNIFGLDGIKHVGKKAIIGATVRIRRPQLFEIEDHSIIDDFAYISCRTKIGKFTHIGAGSRMIGGPEASVTIGDFCNIAPNCCIAAGQNDYKAGGLCGPAIPSRYADDSILIPVKIGDHCLLGFGVSILAGVELPEGVAVGAHSLLKPMKYEPWTVYAGVPAKKICKRDGTKIKEQAKNMLLNGWDA